MSYIGNTPTQQNFVAGADQFSGNGSTVAFTLSRSVNTVFDIFVTVSNVPQDPFTAYTVAGNTLTFDGAPASGTNNIDVVYRATNVQTFVPSPGVSAQFGLGSAASPSITFIGDTNTGIFSPAADTIAFAEGGVESMRLNSSGNVGIGTSSPNLSSSSTALTVNTGTAANYSALELASGGALNYYINANNSAVYHVAAGTRPWIVYTNGSERMRLDTSGNLQFNSGYGSVATAYGCRAWVNFNGTGTVAIRASGNVTSITDVGTGLYYVNFTTAMPNTNYASVTQATNGATMGTDDARCFVSTPSNSYTTGYLYLGIVNSASTAFIDASVINVAIFR